MRHPVRIRKYASLGGRKSAEMRFADKDPKTVRNKRVGICISEIELLELNSKAKAAGLTRTEFIVRLVRNHSSF